MKRLTSGPEDENVLRAIVSLDGDVRWEKVKVWFEESKKETIDLVRGNDNFAYNAGALNEICDLCEQIGEASETLWAINQNRE